MLRLRSLAWLTVLLAAAHALADVGFGQTGSDSEAFFSGTVVDNSAERVTVARTIQGKSPERRTFIINSGTTIEGSLKHNSRVTVRFAASLEGDIALSIIVRDRSERNEKKGRSGSLRASSRCPLFFDHLA